MFKRGFEKIARCWKGYEPVPGKKPFEDGSCRPIKKKKLEKTAAFGNTRAALNKVKGLFTGKNTYYHNTSAKNARKILRDGLIPGGGRGIHSSSGIDKSDAVAGLRARTYMARNPDSASIYGKARYAPRQKLKGGLVSVIFHKLFKTPEGRQLKIEIPKHIPVDDFGVNYSTTFNKIDPKYIKKVR